MTLLLFPLAARFEIAGCFAFWAVLKSCKSPLWLAAGVVALVLFAFLLALVPVVQAGRAYAVYSGITIAASLGWLFAVEGVRPDRWDPIGAMIALVGAGVTLWGPRTI